MSAQRGKKRGPISRVRHAWATRNACRWCGGSGVFQPRRPLACPVCDGAGDRRKVKPS